MSGSWKNGGTGREQIGGTVNTTMCVYDTVPWTAVHTCATKVMVLPAQAFDESVEPFFRIDLHPPETGFAERARKPLPHTQDRSLLELTKVKIKPGSWQAERVSCVRQYDAACHVRRMFQPDMTIELIAHLVSLVERLRTDPIPQSHDAVAKTRWILTAPLSQIHAVVEYLLIRLDLAAEANVASELPTGDMKDGSPQERSTRVSGQRDIVEGDERMLHEEAADQAVLVAESASGRPAGQQKQAAVLNRTGSHDVIVGYDTQTRTSQGTDFRPRDAPAVSVGHQPEAGGVQTAANVCIPRKILPITRAEARRWIGVA